MSDGKSFWASFLGFFGIGEKQREEEALEEDRRRVMRERLAELSEVIDSQVDTLGQLEESWRATYGRVEEYVRERDAQDAAFAAGLAELSDEVEQTLSLFPEDDKAAANRRKILQTLYEESRFHNGMADTLEELLTSRRKSIDALLAQAKAAQASLGGISGVTLEAAMLSARFGEEAGEFAAVCDRIRGRVAEASEELGQMLALLGEEQRAYRETFEQLASLTGQLSKTRDAVTALYEGFRQQKSDAELRPAVLSVQEKVQAMEGQLAEAGSTSRAIEKETKGFRTIDEQEAQSRAEIESVMEEIHKMITEA